MTKGRRAKPTARTRRPRSKAPADLKTENARLKRELNEARQEQAGASKVLSVIARSPGKLEPVFQAMLANATRICEAKFGNLWLREGDIFRIAATHGAPPAYRDYLRREPVTYAQRPSALAEIVRTKQAIQIADIKAAPTHANQMRIATIKLAGARTLIAVPMLKDNEVIGTIGIYRQEVRPFTAKQIELVTNFAAQAVIAIENMRLLNELRQRTDDLSESLEQQTATSEVLGVISSSPGELEPVFQAMLANATRICEAKFANLFLYKDNSFRIAAQQNAPPAYAERWRRNPVLVVGDNPHNPLDRLAATKSVVDIADLMAEPGYVERSPRFVALVESAGARTHLAVPMLKENELVGAISIFRQEVRPFTKKQIELVTNFAAQAVIAIENTRLLKELRQRTDDLSEALEQQTATSEVLSVISSSPGELESVFDVMLENATRLCEAKFGLMHLYEGGAFRVVALHNVPSALADFFRQRGPFVPPAGIPLDRLLRTKKVIHTIDQAADQVLTPSAKLAGARSHIAVPMLKENELVGSIIIYRQEVRPFTEKQIALVTNFAAQAVIAIENTRLLNELRQRTDDLSEALEQQTATSEVLQVISSSPGDLEPVFQAMLENAVRICEAKFGHLQLYKNGAFHLAAEVGTPPKLAEFHRRRGPFQPTSGTLLDRVMRTKQVSHAADQAVDAVPGASARFGGARSTVIVPMLKDDELIGAITIYRQEVRPFTDKHIALVQNFAAQAVIAIENTRLLNELRESLQQQTATSDVLKVISRSTFDLQSVLDTLTESAARLCRADRTAIRLVKDGLYHYVASYGFSPEHKERMEREPLKPGRGSIVGRVVLEGKSVHLEDSQADPEDALVRRSRSGNTRTLLGVPLLREGTPIGVLILQRSIVESFTDKQIELVTTFADQAVIAIENVRLFDEVQARTEDLAESLQQQTATADVLKVISRSTFDLQGVLDTLTASAARLCDADMAAITRQKGRAYYYATTYGFPPAVNDYLKSIPHEAGRGSVVGRTLLQGTTVQVPDVLADSEYTMVEMQQKARFRTVLGVPLLREGSPIGVIVLARADVRPFTDKQIELVSTFADQAVIAIENVRLFDEIQDKSRQLAEASKHKSQFLANMSHELRTPLNAILGYTELILDNLYGATPDKMREVLDRIERNGRHLLGLINDVLDLSKIEAGQLMLALTDYSLKDVVHSVFSAVEPLASEKKLSFKVEVAPNLPAGHGDERRLTQVLLNLVGNAIKFTDKGEVAIKASAQNGSFTVAVHDTGPGIAEADQAKIFEEFQQADSSVTRKKGGTGLGLSISRRIIELHGGRLWVESGVGRGSTFSFTLPVAVEQQAGPS